MSIYYITGDLPDGFTDVSVEFATAVCHRVEESDEATLFDDVVADLNREKNEAENVTGGV
jgi:hypothetical protein